VDDETKDESATASTNLNKKKPEVEKEAVMDIFQQKSSSVMLPPTSPPRSPLPPNNNITSTNRPQSPAIAEFDKTFQQPYQSLSPPSMMADPLYERLASFIISISRNSELLSRYHLLPEQADAIIQEYHLTYPQSPSVVSMDSLAMSRDYDSNNGKRLPTHHGITTQSTKEMMKTDAIQSLVSNAFRHDLPMVSFDEREETDEKDKLKQSRQQKQIAASQDEEMDVRKISQDDDLDLYVGQSFAEDEQVSSDAFIVTEKSTSVSAAVLKEGMKVEADYRGRGRFFPGKIRRDRGDGTYDIDYEDGENELRVSSGLIRSLEAGGEEGGSSSSARASNK
jgi:hypothetical protein